MSISNVAARQVALTYINSLKQEVGCELVLLDASTIERDFGWVFFYNTRHYHAKGDVASALAGNAPLVVTRADGRLHITGTAHPIEHYLSEFEHYKPRP